MEHTLNECRILAYAVGDEVGGRYVVADAAGRNDRGFEVVVGLGKCNCGRFRKICTGGLHDRSADGASNAPMMPLRLPSKELMLHVLEPRRGRFTALREWTGSIHGEEQKAGRDTGSQL